MKPRALPIRLMFFLMAIAFLPQVAFAKPATSSAVAEVGKSHASSGKFFVANPQELKTALQQAQPGSVIAIAPGLYTTGIYLKGVHGSAEAPIVITAVNPDNPPIFEGVNGEGAKLSSCSYIHLANLIFQGFPSNGINIDDGGNVQSPTNHILLENLTIRNIGPKGNSDALKLSGVDHFIVRNCQIEGWGGSGLDLVGCHHGVIDNCRFTGKVGYRNANGVQIKGGSRHILIQNSTFQDAGTRVVHIGGMTGLQYFRPRETDYEARDVTIAGNTFVGGEAQVAWITAQDSRVAHNLFYLPEKWLGRILQESENPRFKPCQRGLFENNLVVADERVKTFFNVGRGTLASSFIFRGNMWFRPGVSYKPALPSPEKEGIYDFDPMIVMSSAGDLKANAADPRLKKVGPWSYSPWRMDKDFGDVVLPPVIVPDAEPSFLDRFKL